MLYRTMYVVSVSPVTTDIGNASQSVHCRKPGTSILNELLIWQAYLYDLPLVEFLRELTMIRSIHLASAIVGASICTFPITNASELPAACKSASTGDPPPVEYHILHHILELDSKRVDYISAITQPDYDETAPVVDLTGTLKHDAARDWQEITKDRLGDRLIYILADELIGEDFVHDLGPVEVFSFQTMPGRLSLEAANALVDRTLGKSDNSGPVLSVAIIGEGLRLERGTVASIERCENVDGQPGLCFQLTATGTKQLWLLTANNAGKVVAITWGNRMLSMPVIREPILGGQGVMAFPDDEAAAEEMDQLICDIMRRWD